MPIRPATLMDCPTLAALAAHDNPSAWRAAQFQAACQLDRHTVLIAENNAGQSIGFIVWQTLPDEIELHLIATAPAFRRQGVASQLLATLFQAACQLQVKRILLEVRESNHGAQTFYAQHGFHTIARRKQYYQSQEDALIMEKKC